MISLSRFLIPACAAVSPACAACQPAFVTVADPTIPLTMAREFPPSPPGLNLNEAERVLARQLQARAAGGALLRLRLTYRATTREVASLLSDWIGRSPNAGLAILVKPEPAGSRVRVLPSEQSSVSIGTAVQGWLVALVSPVQRYDARLVKNWKRYL